jgi:hypothetical protein
MFWELGKVLIDHIERRFKHSIENWTDLGRKERLEVSGPIAKPVKDRKTHAELADNDSHDVENLGVPRSGDIARVVAQDGLEETRNQIHIDPVQIFGLLHIGLN